MVLEKYGLDPLHGTSVDNHGLTRLKDLSPPAGIPVLDPLDDGINDVLINGRGLAIAAEEILETSRSLGRDPRLVLGVALQKYVAREQRFQPAPPAALDDDPGVVDVNPHGLELLLKRGLFASMNLRYVPANGHGIETPRVNDGYVGPE